MLRSISKNLDGTRSLGDLLREEWLDEDVFLLRERVTIDRGGTFGIVNWWGWRSVRVCRSGISASVGRG